MSPTTTMYTLAVLLCLSVCSVQSEDTQELEDKSMDVAPANHQPQKRSAVLLEPADVTSDAAYVDEDTPYFLSDDSSDESTDKRGSLFRFGKRGGSLFRFGKRGSLLRWGKRGSLFRFGKRGGTLFRFGRRSSAPEVDLGQDKRTLFRFGKRSNLDLVREALDSARYPGYESPSKRNYFGDEGFHWGGQE